MRIIKIPKKMNNSFMQMRVERNRFENNIYIYNIYLNIYLVEQGKKLETKDFVSNRRK